jgi:hypothetical protein
MSELKYKVVISEGCRAFYTEINGKLLSEDISNQEIDEFIDYLCSKFKKEYKESTVSLDDLIKCFQPDNWESDEDSCDQCGDTVHRNYWEF